MPFQNLSPKEAAVAPPSPFTFVTAGADVETIISNTLTGIVEAIISGYADLPEPQGGYDAHLDSRIGALAGLASALQAGILASMQEGGLDLTDDQLTALLHPKDGDVLEFEAWDSPIPLMLLATNYIPFSDIVPPEGDSIVWLNPHNEKLFMDSVVQLGVGTLWINDSADAHVNHPAK